MREFSIDEVKGFSPIVMGLLLWMVASSLVCMVIPIVILSLHEPGQPPSIVGFVAFALNGVLVLVLLALALQYTRRRDVRHGHVTQFALEPGPGSNRNGFEFVVRRRLFGYVYSERRRPVDADCRLQITCPNEFTPDFELATLGNPSGTISIPLFRTEVDRERRLKKVRMLAKGLGIPFDDEEAEAQSLPMQSQLTLGDAVFAIRGSGSDQLLTVRRVSGKTSSKTEVVRLADVELILVSKGDTVGEWLRNATFYTLAVVMTGGLALIVIMLLGLKYHRQAPSVSFCFSDAPGLVEMMSFNLENNEQLSKLSKFLRKHTGIEIVGEL